MKYKLKLWRYSVYTTEKAEEMLNQMSHEGWTLSRIKLPFILFEQCENIRLKQRYTVEVVAESRSKYYEEEDKPLIEYYTSMGWNLASYLPQVGACIFSSQYEKRLPASYESEESRAIQCRRKIHWGAAIGNSLLALFIIATQFLSLSQTYIGNGKYIIMGCFLYLYMVSEFIPSGTKIIYRVLGRAGFLIKVADAMEIIKHIGELIMVSAMFFSGIYFIHKGLLFSTGSWLRFIGIFATVASLPMFVLGQYVGLALGQLERANYIDVASYLLSLVTLGGILFQITNL